MLSRNHLFIIFLLIFPGCFTFQTVIEKEEKDRIKSVEKTYRGIEKEPELPDLSASSELKDFVTYALLNNPDVMSSFYEWKASVDTITMSRYLPNPQLTFEGEIRDRAEDFMRAGLMFMFPAPGKLALQAEAYSLEARNKRFAFQEKILTTTFDVKRSLYSLFALKEEIGQTEKMIEILGQVEDIILMKSNVSKTSEIDLLSLHMEKKSLLKTLSDLRDYELFLNTELGSVLGIKNEGQLPFPEELPFTRVILSEEDLWKMVQQNNPSLAQKRHIINQSEVYIKTAYKEYLPDFGIGVERTFFSSIMGMTMPKLTLSIPWMKRIKAQISAAQSNLKRSEADLLSEELDLIVRLADGLFRWRQADREEKLFRATLIPSLESTIELTLTEYRNGTAELEDVLRLNMKLLQYRYSHIAAKALREIMLNEIMLLIAGFIPDEEKPFKGGFNNE